MSSPNSIFQSYSVLQNILLPSNALPPVDDVEKENKHFYGYNTIGGVLLDTKYVWNANGPLFTLYNSKNRVKIASWNFGSIIKSTTTTVSCVVELHKSLEKLPFLIIGLQSDTHGQICLLNIFKSRILRCIEINERVTSLMVVHHKVPPLATYLQAFDIVLAVGTSGGNVYLVDINQLSGQEVLLESEADIRDEINPSQLEIVSLEDDLLEKSFPNTNHLAILLNAEKSDVECFVLRGPKDDVRIYVNKEEVEVSALHYCRQLGSLLVGFNFGAWQLWDLFNMKLIYTSPVYEENIPVSHFGVQEPCDDPRAFCYIWTVYSNIEPNQPGYSLAVLYSLNYDKKEFIEGYGILYKNLTSCSVRFQMDVTNCRNEIEKSPIRAQCVNLQTVKRSISRTSFGDNHDETVTVCFIVWNVWNSTFPNKCKTYLSLFDLNQWYKEQMPGSPNPKDCDTYLSYVCLTNILRTNDKILPLLDVRINPNTLNQFVGSQRLEEHYHPSSLAFQMVALNENCISIINNQGNQRALMTNLENLGPSVLLKPTEPFLLSVNLGLTPLFIDVPNKMATTLEYQRELLLSVALEQKLLGWLCKCVSTWSSGVYENSGCSLNLMLSWGWQRAQILKENADKLSVVLFDFSGLRLDANTHNLLSNCSEQLKDIATLFKFIERKYLGFVLNPDVVKDQCESLELASSHLEVVDWLLNIGLLPECPENNYPRADEFGRMNAPYSIDSLNEYYQNRRSELSLLGKKHFSSNDSLLFIDNLIDFEFGGNPLQKQWNVVSECVGYPPQSLQALMRTYLVENVSLLNKHCLVAYLLLDISAALDQDRYKSVITHLLKFPSIFHLSPSITKIVQSLWQLDHGEFEAAVEQLLDPIISANDLQLWHHRIILKVLLAYEQHRLALAYLLERQPAITEISDLCTILRLYIANNMIGEAFYFQRQNQSLDVASTLLEHFYKECDKVGSLKSIIFLFLTKEEEDVFMKYLNDVKHPQANELKIYYYTQHSRYVDAMKIYDKTGTIKTGSRGLEGQNMLSDADNIINKLTNVFNPLSRSIMDQLKKRDLNVLKESNPQPFSVFVHNSDEHVKYKSSLIEAALVKAKETWTSNKTATNNIHDDIPFLCTPRTNLPTPRVLTPLIYPKCMLFNNEDGPSSPKRFKPMSRLSVSTAERSWDSEVTCTKLSVRLNTPVVKRKSLKTLKRKFVSQANVETPQSILKSQIAILSESDDKYKSHYTIKDNTHPSFVIGRNSPSTSRTKLNLTPRRSLLSNSRPAVRFSFSKPPSESSVTSNSSDPDFEVIEENALVHSSLDGKDSIQNSSLEESPTDENVSFDSSKKQESEKDLDEYKKSLVRSSLNLTTEPPKTPRSRRSYREQIYETSVRSSPRLQKLKQIDVKSKEEDISIIELSSTNESLLNAITENTLEPPKTSRSRRSYKDISRDYVEPEPLSISKEILLLPRTKLQGRRSLSRTVLENNTYTRITEVERVSSTLESSLNEVDVKRNDDISEIQITEHLGHSKSGDVTKPLETIVTSKLFNASRQSSNEREVEVETIPEEVVPMDLDAEEAKFKDADEANYSVFEVIPVISSTRDTDAEGEKNSSGDADEVDVNIYDSSEDDSEAIDPKLSVFDVSSDLTFNDAICPVDDNSVETNSIYVTDSGEVFGDKSDVLIALDDNVTKTTINTEHDNNILKVSTSDVELSTSDAEVIELDSSSDEVNLDEDIYSSENESSVHPTDSEDSTSTSSNVLSNEHILSSKDVTEPYEVAHDDEKKTTSEFTNNTFENVVIEEIQQNIEMSSIDTPENVQLQSIYEDEEESNLQTSSFRSIVREQQDNDGIVNTFTKIDATKNNSNVVEKLPEDSTEELKAIDLKKEETKNTESSSNVEDESNACVESNDKKSSYTNVIDKDLFDESIDITPHRELNDTFDRIVDAGTSKTVFMASTPSGSMTNWNENEYESDILDETVNRSENWSFESDLLTTPANQRKIIYQPNSQDCLIDATPYKSTNNPKIVLDDMFLTKQNTPARRRSQRVSSLHTTNTSQTSDLRKYTLRKRSLSTSQTNASVDPLKLKQSLLQLSEKLTPSKRRRSSSTNAHLLVPPRSKRGASVDVELLSGRNNDSKTKQPVETSTSESTRKPKSRKSKSVVVSNETNLETYSSSRRLTRRQAELLKKNLGVEHIELKELVKEDSNNSNETNHSPSRGPDIDEMDPLNLLHKKSFEGDPDPDEDLMNKSPVSSLAESPIGNRLRSKSSLSNTSICSETSPTTVESKKKKAKRTLTDGVATSKIRQQSRSPDSQSKNKLSVPRKIRKTRLTSKDTDVSDASTISQTHSVIEVRKPGAITRRTRSVTDEIEQPLRRSERNILSKSSLPKIVEEHNAHHSKKTTKTAKK